MRLQDTVTKIEKIAIIGLGLVGASFAAALSQAGRQFTLVGVDTDERSCETARSNAWVERAFSPDDPAFEALVRTEVDLVVLATPVTEMAGYFEKLVAWDYEGIVTDTASTKELIAQQADKLLKHPQNYIPGHPMAGSEVSGIAGARPELFQGAHWILCPDATTTAEQYRQLHELITGIGARVVSLPRHEHDKAVAIVSHVPHIVASSLVELAARHADDQQMLFRLAAGGFKDSTRIAAGSAQLWTGISFENATALGSGLLEICEIIARFSEALKRDDKETFKKLLQNAATTRRSLPLTLIPDTEKLLEVRIPLTDRKGIIAEVTNIASQAGCNIQSIDIDHVTSNSAVLNLILTDEGDIGMLSKELIVSGFSVSFNPLSAKEYTHVG